MLVITRKVGDKIMIGHDIEITLVSIMSPHEVRIGVEAPSGVKILRGELLESDGSGSIHEES